MGQNCYGRPVILSNNLSPLEDIVQRQLHSQFHSLIITEAKRFYIQSHLYSFLFISHSA